ncbi:MULTISPECIES: GNAT family N-acetyltransferase [unclassified Meridianimarinicoccus]|uniref:GNAT family N-acetyltransferase n=1 Tax=unclassified Meridianimarinicoccus TaxID=2923344 RepID=UPI001867B2DD|nr:GNAT family N-acetyltransferase [Fluviibacterium sp. MJW13]
MIRPYTDSDKAAVMAIWREANAQAHPFLSAEVVAQADTLIATQLLQVADTHMYETDGRCVGFLSLLGAEIGGLFILPAWQGHGFGRALLDHAATLHPELHLCVFHDNSRARAFYDRYGFEPVEDRRNAMFDALETVMRYSVP